MFRYLYVYFVAKLYYTANKFVFNYVYVKASILNTFILFNCMLWFVLLIWRNKTKLFKKKKCQSDMIIYVWKPTFKRHHPKDVTQFRTCVLG